MRRHHRSITTCFAALQHQFRRQRKVHFQATPGKMGWEWSAQFTSCLIFLKFVFPGCVAAKVRDRLLHSRHSIVCQWDAQCFLTEILFFLPLLSCLVCVTIYVTVVLLLISKLLWNSPSWIISQNSKCCFCWQLRETSQHCITQKHVAFYSHPLFLFPSLFFGLGRKQW